MVFNVCPIITVYLKNSTVHYESFPLCSGHRLVQEQLFGQVDALLDADYGIQDMAMVISEVSRFELPLACSSSTGVNGYIH